MLRDDEVGLAEATAVLVVGIFAVDEDHHVGILFEAVVHGDAIGDEVVTAQHGGVEDVLPADVLDVRDLVPQNVVGGHQLHLLGVEDPRQPLQMQRL